MSKTDRLFTSIENLSEQSRHIAMGMSRILLTVTTVSVLAVAYRVYSAVLLPLTEMREQVRPLVEAPEKDIQTPMIFEQKAVRIFPDAPWTHQAQQTWQMAERAYLYFNDQLRVPGTGNTIQISPVAIFWHDPRRPGAPPFRVLAERAQIKFENSFFDTAIALSGAEPGRIVWASLEGHVHIDGPDGLVIDGQNFKFEEDSSQLYSDHAVAFSYGPTMQDKRRLSGTADQLQLTFVPSHESILGKDMPRVGGLAQILLRRNVVLDMTFEQQGQARQAQVSSDGSFLYDVEKREATIDQNVHVVHITEPLGAALKDQLDCDWLHLKFDSTQAPADTAEVSPMSAFDGLVFRSLRAQGANNGKGTRLKVTSDEQQLAAVMQDLTYDARERRAVLIDQQQVVIHRANAKFACPQIALQHSPTNQLEAMQCRGPGQMDVAQSDPGAPPVITRWGGGVNLWPDPQSGVHLVHIEQDALLGVPGQFGIAADVVKLWVDLERAQSASAGDKQQNVLARALPLKRARAEGHVRLDSAMLRVDRSELIDAVISPGVIKKPAERTNPTQQAEGAREDEDSQQPWVVSADALSLDLIHDSGAAAIDVRQVTGTGNIVIEHDSGGATSIGEQSIDGPLVIKGASLLARNSGGIQQTVTVRGETDSQGEMVQNASVAVGAAKLWGGQITLSRAENRVDVPGSGGMNVPLPQDVNGQASAEPLRLNIVWDEGMTFDGHAARFWGKVTAAVPGEQQSITRLLCEDLTATLNQRFSFAEPQQREGELGISNVDALHHVVVESFEYAQNRLVAVRRSELAGIHAQLESGDFQGDGPGVIHSWTFGDSVKFSPGEGPQANQPVRATSPDEEQWRYSTVKFSGKINGNMNRQDATISERVEVLTAPVEKALAKFRRDQLSERTPQAENAVWMRCDQMRILQKQFGNQPEKFYEVFATGGTELEGHVFRAVADELTYDERRGQFILRGLGKEARLYHQPEPGQPVSPTAARRIEFVPSRSKIIINGSTGISGSR